MAARRGIQTLHPPRAFDWSIAAETPGDIVPALRRAMAVVASGRPALVNVVTDWRARATTAAFTRYVT